MKTASTTSTPASTTQPAHPDGFSPEIVELLCALIRQRGLSDAAASEEAGLSTSVLTRWKAQFPEIGILLLRARALFRRAHLDNILEASRAEGGRGWRASAWLLEHVFPADYAPKAMERARFQDLADDLREQEAEAAVKFQLPTPTHGSDSHISRNAATPATVPQISPLSAAQRPGRPAPLAGQILPETVAIAA